jgi:carboxyl-terminal processing protease
MKINRILFILLLNIYALAAFGQVATIDERDVSQLRQKTFDRVWSLVNERHFDPTFGGVDWKKVGENYRPLALAAKTNQEFHAVLNQMIGELNQSHFSIYTPEGEQELTKCNDGIVGADVKIVENKVLVTRLESNSPAEKAGLKMGFEIVKIDNRSIPEILLPVETSFTGRKLSDTLKQTYRERTLNRILCGKPETTIKIEALNKQNKSQSFSLTRTAYNGEIDKVAEGLPPFKLLFEAKRLPSNIGYVSFNVWLPKQANRVRDAIVSMRDTKGIIIDLRGNSGGQGNLVNTVGGVLFSDRVSFGKTKTRFGGYDFWAIPQENVYDGKIVILTNNGTGSTSEIFAGGMKDLGRAEIIGERTAGAVLPATIEKLPTGANFMYAVADYRTPTGVLLEGRGVTPDIEVRLTRPSLLEGRDLQMEAAIRELRKVIEE